MKLIPSLTVISGLRSTIYPVTIQYLSVQLSRYSHIGQADPDTIASNTLGRFASMILNWSREGSHSLQLKKQQYPRLIPLQL